MTQPPVDTFEHAGLEVRIRWEEWDTEHANPRDMTNLGVMFCDHPSYNLGDVHADDPRGQTIDCPDCDGSGEGKEYEILDRRAYGRVIVTINDSHAPRFDSFEAAEAFVEQHQPDDQEWIIELRDCERCEGSGEIEVSIVEYLKREHDARVVIPLFLYDHSGITMRAGGRLDTGEDNLVSRNRFTGDAEGWDTSTVGVIYDTAESRKECGCEDFTAERIEEGLKEEVAYYAAYLEGSVFGYEIVGEDDEVIDSCWGFLELNVWDDDAGVREEAKSAAESCREQIEQEKAEALRWACADVVTV